MNSDVIGEKYVNIDDKRVNKTLFMFSRIHY